MLPFMGIIWIELLEGLTIHLGVQKVVGYTKNVILFGEEKQIL